MEFIRRLWEPCIVGHVSAAQIRGARGMLDWSMIELSQAAQVSLSTVQRIEEVQPQSVSANLRAAVQSALEEAGVRFLPEKAGLDEVTSYWTALRLSTLAVLRRTN